MSEEARFSDGYFTVPDGLRLHYRDYPGDKSTLPILCLHGLTRNGRDFEQLADRLSPAHRVLALDFRGRGLSDYDPDPARYNPLTYVGDVLALLDHLALDRAVFIGTSLGGLVTMTLCAFAPDRIAAAVLNDIGPQLNDVGIDRIKSYVGNGARFANWNDAAAAVAANHEHRPRGFGPEQWAVVARRMCREEGGEIRFDYDQAIALPFETRGPAPDVDMWPLFLKLVERPVLVTRGEYSDLLSREALDRMAAASPNVSTVEIPEVAHAPSLDEPEAVAAIEHFLAEIEP